MKAFFLGLAAGILLLLVFHLNSKSGAVKALGLVKAKHQAKIDKLKDEILNGGYPEVKVEALVTEINTLSESINSLNQINPESIDAQALADIIGRHLHPVS